MKITLIAGARPNFMKIAPLIKAIKAHNEGLQVTGDGLRDEKISYRLVHTGQHYDKNMSDTFFEELGIPAPDVNLGCGGGTQAEQTAAIMIAFEKELMAHPATLPPHHRVPCRLRTLPAHQSVHDEGTDGVGG